MLIYLDIKIPHLQIAHQGGNLEVGNIKIHLFDGLVESMVDVDRQQLCDILEHGEGWRRVMGVVPRSRQDRTNKYSADQVWKLHLDCHTDIGDDGKCTPSKPERLDLQTSSACDYDNLDSKTGEKGNGTKDDDILWLKPKMMLRSGGDIG